VHTDATDSVAEEDATCYLQIVLADALPGVGRERLMADMDAWGYTFRLGSARAWFEQDAEDAGVVARAGLPPTEARARRPIGGEWRRIGQRLCRVLPQPREHGLPADGMPHLSLPQADGTAMRPRRHATRHSRARASATVDTRTSDWATRTSTSSSTAMP
jgi:hypothetical protein